MKDKKSNKIYSFLFHLNWTSSLVFINGKEKKITSDKKENENKERKKKKSNVHHRHRSIRSTKYVTIIPMNKSHIFIEYIGLFSSCICGGHITSIVVHILKIVKKFNRKIQKKRNVKTWKGKWSRCFSVLSCRSVTE